MSNDASSNWHIERPSAGLNYCPATDQRQLLPLRHVGFYQLRTIGGLYFLNDEKRRMWTRTLARNNDINGFEPACIRPCATRHFAAPTASYYLLLDQTFWPVYGPGVGYLLRLNSFRLCVWPAKSHKGYVLYSFGQSVSYIVIAQ